MTKYKDGTECDGQCEGCADNQKCSEGEKHPPMLECWIDHPIDDDDCESCTSVFECRQVRAVIEDQNAKLDEASKVFKETFEENENFRREKRSWSQVRSRQVRRIKELEGCLKAERCICETYEERIKALEDLRDAQKSIINESIEQVTEAVEKTKLVRSKPRRGAYDVGWEDALNSLLRRLGKPQKTESTEDADPPDDKVFRNRGAG